MIEDTNILSEDNIARVKDLLASMERGDAKGANEVLDELSRIRESDIYKEMGKLTRDLHDAISAFGMDEQLSELAENEIPDARQRLHHVIDMTDKAAHRTLSEVEQSLPVCEGLESRSISLRDDWQRFKSRDMNLDEFKLLAKQLDEFFDDNTSDATSLRQSLNNVLMAQDFQDLTSQIIKKVIKLVEEVESNLVEIIKLTGAHDLPKEDAKRKEEKLAGPVVPGVNDRGTVSGQDDVDDLLSSLGF